MIPEPSCSGTESDRETECQKALHGAFHEMRRRAEAAGWNGEEVSRALLALSIAHIRVRVGRTVLKWSARRGGEGSSRPLEPHPLAD